ncbi:MAG: hybrid sensor histidine kinase/response regulator [Deltaproteobacteria bacterium]|nr:hybrid sensor histidine kinase/response regulator [Deltaproteobacteria bacterium]
MKHPKNSGKFEDIQTSDTYINILLIDDDEDDFIVIRDLLSDFEAGNFSIDWVPDFEEAIRVLNENKHDICLLDYWLNSHSGLELLEQIDASKSHMPIVFLTGQGDYQVDIKAMQAGADDYLVKNDISQQLLERTIRYSIERRKSKNALERAYAEMEQEVVERTAELAKTNELLQESSEKIKQFAYSVSHDLKNPAIGIYGLTKRLLNHYSKRLDDRGQKICTQILCASEQIASLVENINIYIATKEMPITYEEINLKEICRIIQEEFSTTLAIRGIKWSEPENTHFIKADRLSVIRALRNLVDNALKYGGDSLNMISISCIDSSDHHIILVRDNGGGLEGEDSKKIFSLFFREKRIKSINGTGMGLAIVKEIAERHGGDAWAESSPNQGTTIFVSFSKVL